MNLQEIGRRLAFVRAQLGKEFTQDVMAEQLGVSKRSYCAYEAGDTPPNAKFLASLAAKGVDIAFVLTGMKTDTYAMLAAVKAGTDAGAAVEALTGNKDAAYAVQEAVVAQQQKPMYSEEDVERATHGMLYDASLIKALNIPNKEDYDLLIKLMLHNLKKSRTDNSSIVQQEGYSRIDQAAEP